jgi:hypothetical protein
LLPAAERSMTNKDSAFGVEDLKIEDAAMFLTADVDKLWAQFWERDQSMTVLYVVKVE